jgi:hypothetical protein
MFTTYNKKKNRKQQYTDVFENLDNLSNDEIFTLYLTTISSGEYDFFLFLLKKRYFISISFLEYALIYGRYDILEHILKDDKYIDALNQNEYNPFNLNHCIPNITNDIYDGSYWSNDEHERHILNCLNHEMCFQLLEKFNKKLDKTNIIKWVNLSNGQIKYYGGTYFPQFDVLLKELFKKEITISLVLSELKDVISNNILLKMIIKMFKTEEIIEKLM